MDCLSELETVEARSKLEKMYKLYWDAMFATANGILKDQYLAEDAVQEAFLRIARNLSKVRDAASQEARAFAVVIVSQPGCVVML